MKCPLCDGDFESVELRIAGNTIIHSKRCTQCSGWWFSRELTGNLNEAVIAKYEKPLPSYSLKTFDLTCPNDQTLLQQSDHQIVPNGAQYWQCPECDGIFFPKGQLALFAAWRGAKETSRSEVGYGRVKAAEVVSLIIVLLLVVTASVNRTNLSLSASEPQTLPTGGPNIFTLILLSLTYLAGTVLAVLSRKLAVIIIGWAVVAICLFGFAVIVFGP